MFVPDFINIFQSFQKLRREYATHPRTDRHDVIIICPPVKQGKSETLKLSAIIVNSNQLHDKAIRRRILKQII
jgi:hypothetical protein